MGDDAKTMTNVPTLAADDGDDSRRNREIEIAKEHSDAVAIAASEPEKRAHRHHHRKSMVAEKNDAAYLADVAATANPLLTSDGDGVAAATTVVVETNHATTVAKKRRMTKWIGREGYRCKREATEPLPYPYRKSLGRASEPTFISVYEGPEGTITFVLVECSGTQSDGMCVGGGSYVLSRRDVAKLCAEGRVGRENFKAFFSEVLGETHDFVKAISTPAADCHPDADLARNALVEPVDSSATDAKSRAKCAAERIMAEESKRTSKTQESKFGSKIDDGRGSLDAKCGAPSSSPVLLFPQTISRLPFDGLREIDRPDIKAGSQQSRSFSKWKASIHRSSEARIFFKASPIVLKERFIAEYIATKRDNKGCTVIIGSMEESTSNSARDRRPTPSSSCRHSRTSTTATKRQTSDAQGKKRKRPIPSTSVDDDTK